MYYRTDGVAGFLFLEKAIWPEIVNAMETRCQYIFNPGNPDAFHEVFLLATEIF